MSVLQARSARGLSLPAYILETAACAITLAYSYRNSFPFFTYGENFSLSAQNALITLLIIAFPAHKQKSIIGILAGTLAIGALFYGLYSAPKELLSQLQGATIPLSILSRLPQILQNKRAQSTGNLASLTILLQVLGSLARVFTTVTEVKDTLMAIGSFVAFALNAIIGLQVLKYRSTNVHPVEIKAPIPVRAEPIYIREKTPPPVTPNHSRPSTPSSRKWSRKVD